MQTPYDFHLIRGILLKAEAGEVCEGKSREYHVLAPYFEKVVKAQGYWPEEGYAVLHRMWTLKDSGLELLDLLRDESRIDAMLAFAESLGKTLTLKNVEVFSQLLDEWESRQTPTPETPETDGDLAPLTNMNNACNTSNTALPLVFISWSGAHEKQIALNLKAFLEVVLPVKVFVSSRDLHSNAPGWRASIMEALQTADYGIVCLTERNKDAPWVMYESGALDMRLGFRNLSVLALDLDPKNLPSPLDYKHARAFDIESLECLLEDICLGLNLKKPASCAEALLSFFKTTKQILALM